MPHGIDVFGSVSGWLKGPTGIAVGPRGNVFVADQGNDRIQKFTAGGGFLTQFGTQSRGPGYTVAAVAVAPDGTA